MLMLFIHISDTMFGVVFPGPLRRGYPLLVPAPNRVLIRGVPVVLFIEVCSVLIRGVPAVLFIEVVRCLYHTVW